MQNQPELLDQFPYSTDAQWFNALQFVRKAPFAENFWQTFKGLYKKVETYVQASPELCAGSVQKLVSAFIERLDAVTPENIKNERFPTVATLGYMKRRARRLLNGFGKTNADIYVTLAKNLLIAQEDKQAILPAQWICLDLFWANSRKYEQTGFGHNHYKLNEKVFQFKQVEERFSEIWENNPQILFDILQKNIPNQVSEFAVKILQRKEINLPALSEQKLVNFFESGLVSLQRTAVKMSYEKLAFQNISPELYAGLWLFATPDLQKKAEEILKKSIQITKEWENNFANSLTKITWGLLKKGNNSNRVIKAFNYLDTKFPTKLKQLDAEKIASALLQSKHKTLHKLAITSVQNAKKEDAMAWLLALGTERNTTTEDLYEKIKLALAGKFPSNLDGNITRPFIFNSSYFVADFGWHLTSKMQQWYVYKFWNQFMRASAVHGKRRDVFMNAITSPSGIAAFKRYYEHSDYFISQFQFDNLNFILAHAGKEIVDLFKKYHKEQFQNSPIYNLTNLAFLPDALRNEILQESLPAFKNKDVFNYAQYINNVFEQSVSNNWLLGAVKQLIENSKFSKQSAYSVFDALLNNQNNNRQAVFAMLLTLSQGRQGILLETVSNNPNWLVNHASLFPTSWRELALKNLNIDAVMNIVRDAQATEWEILKVSIYDFLQTKPQPSSFWKGILETAISMPDSPLVVRILENKDCRKIFLQLQDASILEIAEPELEDLLSEWASANTKLFAMGTHELFRLCIHKLPKLRQAGYALARQHGITVVFALRLMESDLPEAMGEGQAFFNALPAQSDNEWDALLGMIDSPNRQVRIFALAYWKGRAEHLGTKPQLLPFLSEHADQAVQEAVAREIKEKKVENPFVQRFEKEVLRQKNKARKAKDIVKAHIEETLAIDAQTLIELAQSANKREAEWAIVQLTKKALAGEDTAGFVLQ